jgi:RNA polymerase sigma factor (sigma-70 family)
LNDTAHELTTAIASGDTEAFARFYRERFDAMYAEARRVTGRDEAFCLDVVQDAMIKVIRSMRPLSTEARLSAWLRAVVKSGAYDRLRREARRKRWERSAVDVRQSAVEESDGHSERLEWLRGELAGLDEPQLRLLTRRYRLGWTLRRIGEAMGLRPGAVDGRIGRLVGTLRRRAEETFDD